MDDVVACDHKDCERDASPVELMHYSPHGDLLDQHTYYFCREHREALHALKTTPTLPPAEWFEHVDVVGGPRPGRST